MPKQDLAYKDQRRLVTLLPEHIRDGLLLAVTAAATANTWVPPVGADLEPEGLSALETMWGKDEGERLLTAGLYALPMQDKVAVLANLEAGAAAGIIGRLPY